MSRYALDPQRFSYLRGARRIESDRPCRSCGYNLRGLLTSALCPECGTPVRASRVDDDAFESLPESLIQTLRAGAWLSSIGAFGFIIVHFFARFMPTSARTDAMAVLAFAGMWCVGAWLLTRPLEMPGAVSRGLSRDSRLRQAARWLQLAWLGYLGPFVWAALTGMPASGAAAITTLSAAAALSGLFMLLILLGRLAEWMHNDFAERAFNFTVWGTAISVPALLVFPAGAAFVGGLFIIIFPFVMLLIVLALIVSVAAVPVGLFSLARTVEWSLRYRREKAERLRALQEGAADARREARMPEWISEEPLALAPPAQVQVPEVEKPTVGRKHPAAAPPQQRRDELF